MVSSADGDWLNRVAVPEHLFYTAWESYHGIQQTRRLAGLPTKYINVFSTGYGDIARSRRVKHGIAQMEEARSVRFPLHRLELAKEAEAE